MKDESKAALQKAVESGDSGVLRQLLELLVSREKVDLIKSQSDVAARESHDRSARQENDAYVSKRISAIVRCGHLKGGVNRDPQARIDYNVYLHTFVDGSQRIKCNECKMHWRPADTVETLNRDGNEIPNFTKIGWKEAVAMLYKSTNKRSASELGQAVSTVVDPSTQVNVPNLQV
jgi:hypothetical protein